MAKKPRLVNKRHLNLKFKRLFPDTGDRLWAYRQSLNATQKGLGEDCELSAGVIGNIERGYSLGMGKSLLKISKGLGISVDYLLNLSDDQEVKNPTIGKNRWQTA